MTDPSLRTFAVQAKPVGGACNLRCSYCYYRDRGTRGPMSPEVLEAYILQTLRAHGRNAEVEFSWHGGEPTLAGLDFFRRAVELERLHGAGRRIRNTLQTNGILLDDPWCRFFRDHRFLVGVSLDGPRALHDRYRGGFVRLQHATEPAAGQFVGHLVRQHPRDAAAMQGATDRRIGVVHRQPWLHVHAQAE